MDSRDARRTTVGGERRTRRWKAEDRVSAMSGACIESAPHHVLVAEDDDELRSLLSGALRAEGFEVTEARDGSELLDHLGSLFFSGKSSLDLVVTDVRMPGFSGLNVLAGLRGNDWTTPVIVITAFGDQRLHEEASRLGALAVFDKPFDLKDLRDFIRGVLSDPR